MDALVAELKEGRLHHATLVTGTAPKEREALAHACAAHAQVQVFVYDVLHIADARALRTQLSRVQHRAVHVVEATAIAREAQHALLKVCEEPAPGNHLIFLLPSVAGLMTTLRSRLQIREWSRGEPLGQPLRPAHALTEIGARAGEAGHRALYEYLRSLAARAAREPQGLSSRKLAGLARALSYCEEHPVGMKAIAEYLVLH